jgi:hypothetical protein
MEFKNFKKQFQENVKKVLTDAEHLFVTDIDKEVIWNTYLNSFPENQRQEFNCSHCRHFLKPYANVVAIKDNKLVTFWDFDTEEPYSYVVKCMNTIVLSSSINNVFVNKFKELGVDYNHVSKPGAPVAKWEHFHLVMPAKFVNGSSASEEALMGQYRDVKNVFKRSLEEITADAIDTTLELIAQNSLYRGEEFKSMIEVFHKYHKAYNKLPEGEKENYCWIQSIKAGASIAKIKNHSIGTLLMNISEGMELDHAVSAFEKIMAPTNYKRPTVILTKAMIDKAQKEIVDLGFENSLGRRFATIDDITVNNVLFANRDSKKAMNAFDELKGETTVNAKKLTKVEEITIEKFISDVLPKTTKVELLMESRHSNNLMSLVAPKDVTAPTMFKWHNNFSWSYSGEVTDSIKEKVKAAGGNVVGDFRVSLAWNNSDDYDLHMMEPDGNHIYYPNKRSTHPSSGTLDVDANGGDGLRPDPVENIIYTDKRRMLEGRYRAYVNNYSCRNRDSYGFTVEMEFMGEIYTFEYDKFIADGENVTVAEFTYSHAKGIEFIKSLDMNSSVKSKEVWGIHTNQFQSVALMMFSPNHWDEKVSGNKHYFFIMSGCKNPGTPRGFYNEFLKEDLLAHKRVFEALGSKMKVEDSDSQLSGLGFSSTNKNSIICKVEGAMTRTLKINF